MSGHFDDDQTRPPPARDDQPTRVDCGECPNVTSGCAVGHCSKAPPPKVQIGPLDV